MSLDPIAVPTLLSKLVSHFLDMHRWQKMALTLAVVVFGAGGAHQLTTFFGATAPATTAPSAVGEPPSPEPTIGDKVSPVALGVGASFIVGFLLGFALRAFLRITSLLVIGYIGLMLLLSRFHVVNIDFSEAKTEYASSMHWLGDQANHLRTAVLSHLPHSTTGTLGVIAGFRRRKLRI